MTKTALRIALVTSVAMLAFTASALAVPPTADFTSSWTQPPTAPSIGQQVTFTGTVDWGAGTPGTVTWNFGDGGTATGATATHAFASGGLKFVTMTATNGEAEATPVTKFLTVNSPPVAGFGWAPTTGTTGQDVRFASESDDPDGTIASYAWDFGDGVTDARRNPEHPFESSGTKTVTLTVTDAFGATDSVTGQVTIVDPPPTPAPPNDPPVARFAFSPRSPEVGDPVEFVSSSFDPEGNLRSQTWDLDGDGQFDDARGDEVVYTFPSAGPKTVRLRVEDGADNANVAERTISVQPRPRAKAGTLSPAPFIRFTGLVLSTGSRVRVLSVRAPKGALVTVRCAGKGCKVKQRRKRVKGRAVRFKTYERFLRAGTKLDIYIRKPGTVGAFTRYKIRAGKGPRRIDRCLPPGPKTKPKRC